MWRHRTDVVAFVFSTFFLVCAGLAIGVRTGDLGLGASAPDGAWIAGTVLAVAGAIGVVGTLSSRRHAVGDGPPTEPVTAAAEPRSGDDPDDDEPVGDPAGDPAGDPEPGPEGDGEQDQS